MLFRSLEIDRYALYLTHKLQTEVLADYDRYEFHLAVQKLVSFCSDDLGAFYLDILKDRLYTSGENSPARRAAQSTLHHITHSFMRLIAPILSFTADEIWQILNLGEQSVFEDTWYALPKHGLGAEDIKVWELTRSVRATALKHIELLREEGKVGSSLQAEIDVNVDKNTYELLKKLGEDLRFIMITSKANLQAFPEFGSDTKSVSVQASAHKKCERCWHYVATVGENSEHPSICSRCVSNLFGAGEVRKYA